MSAFAYYQEGELDDVIEVSEDFILNHPSDSDASYMYYLKSISYYDHGHCSPSVFIYEQYWSHGFIASYHPIRLPKNGVEPI